MVSLGIPDSSFIIITDSETALAMSDELQFVADSLTRRIWKPRQTGVCRTSYRRGYEMAEGSVEERVKTIIVDELGVDEGEVTPNARFIDDLGADSLDTVELVMRFEEEFNIEIPDEDAEKIQSVRDAIDYIEKHSK